MTLWFRRALGAVAAIGILAGGAGAQAQANRGWVDPPANPATKPETPTPAAPAPEATRPASAPALASKPAPSTESNASASKRLVRVKSKPVVETRQAEEKRTVDTARPAASRRAATADQPRQERVIREAGSEPLELMTLRTIEFPDGRRVQVLIRPDPETTTGLLRR